MLPPTPYIVRASRNGITPCMVTLVCSICVTASFIVVGLIFLAWPVTAMYLLYPCLTEIAATEQLSSGVSQPSSIVVEDLSIRLVGACFLAFSVSSLGLLVPGMWGSLQHRHLQRHNKGSSSKDYVVDSSGGLHILTNYFFLRTLFFLQGSMGLSLVGVGAINLASSEDDYGHAKDYNCNSLKDQSTLWMGVWVMMLTSFGLMASFWPRSIEEDGQTSQSTSYRVESPNSVMEPLLGLEMIQDGASINSCDHASTIDEHEEITNDGYSTAANVNETNEPTTRLRGTSRLLKLAGNQSIYLWIGIIVLVIRLPFSLAIPHFVSTTIGDLLNEDYAGAKREILLLFLLGTVDAVLDFWCVYLFGKAKENIVRAVRVDTFASLMRQEQAFFDTTNTGDLISRLTSDCGEMAEDLTWFFRFSVEAVVRMLGIAFYMFLRNSILAACTVAIVPFVGLLNKFYGSWLAKNAVRVQNALADATSCAHESLSCIKTVIMLGSEDQECEKYKSHINRLYDLNIWQLIATGVYYMFVSTFLINTLVQATLLLLGSIFVQQGKLTADVLLAFMLYQGQLQTWSLNLFQSYSSLIKSSGAGDRVFYLLDRHPPPPGTGNSTVKSVEVEHVESTNTTKEDITFDNVSFSYPSRPDTVALSNLSLKIERGSVVALVGHSGCGKSTIVSLLQRFYDPDEGTIRFGDMDLKMMSLKSHRAKLGVVSQDPVLFTGTIEENIRYGTTATHEEIVTASRIANAHSFIAQFPNGYNEEVGERGQSLSGGQRQRIAISRALARKPDLLLLDEATSALDPESEAAVQEALDELLQNRSGMTTIIIAHRLQTVRCADTIYVMKNGSLVEQGSHDELLQRGNGHYRRMLDRADSNGLLH